MENAVLRRQYDLEDVILRRAGEYLRFEVPGLKDIHPPILAGDPIAVIDTADSKGKASEDLTFLERLYIPYLCFSGLNYEAYIFEIRGQDIYAKFDEDFKTTYKSTPVRIQFRLGRTTYKRCHHAIEQAVRHLGEDWLFPGEVVECKPARIPFIEESTQDEEEIENGCQEGTKLSLFKNRRPAQSSSTFRPTGRTLNRRITSLKSPFESDTQGPSGETLTLTWFNKLLNQEQKDAVRRILRGQSRPLPYVSLGFETKAVSILFFFYQSSYQLF